MKARLNRQLPGLASEIVGREEAHDYLHQLVVDMYQVEGLSLLSDNEARMLIARLQGERAKVNQVLARAVALTESQTSKVKSQKDEEGAAQFVYDLKDDSPAGRITQRQMEYIRELQALLAWHDRYMDKLIRVRYDENYLDTMPSWKANRLIKLMQGRWHSKKSKVKSQESKSHEE